MKKLLLLSVGTLLTGMLAAQALPNGGFENWSNTPFYDLNGYDNSNDQYMAQGYGVSGINVVRSTNFFSGKYAVQLSTVKVGADTLFAYITDGINNPLQGGGGIPYAQKPTGISFHYMSNIVAGDTAGVMAVFKKAHSIIGIYLFPITTTQASYTLYSKALAPALPMTPDTVIFAAISSAHAIYNNNNSKGCYPGNSITIDSVNFTGGVTQPLLLNGSFENWTSDTAYNPTGWNSLYPGTFQTTDFYSGSYALQLTTKIASYNGGSPEPGFTTTGNVKNSGQGGYPYSLTKDTFEFYYKYAPANIADSGAVTLDFKKAGSGIGFAGMELKSAAAYTLVKVGFNLGIAPDTVIVSFSSSKTNNPPLSYVGSVLKVDKAFFKSQEAVDLGVNEMSLMGGIKVYPNPTNGQVNVDLTNISGSLENIAMYDMSGRMLSTQSYSGGVRSTIETIDISGFSAGIYLIEATTSKGKFYQKIYKQ